jgi:fructosamine-3-kinase
MWQQITDQIAQVTGKKLQFLEKKAIGGGCINQGYALQTNLQTYFVKLNHAALKEIFIAEAIGLQQIQATSTIYVPQVICSGTITDQAYLVLEWLDLANSAASHSPGWQLMGAKLAAMHQFPVMNLGLKNGFGWISHNNIGSTPQINYWMESWSDFFAQHRIGYQLQLAKQKGGDFPSTQQVVEAVSLALANHHPQPSLVHGDLWGGNAAITNHGEPVIFDPAGYIGDREVDLAMTKLFGGFPREFYQEYQQVFPLAPGYEKREIIYNLYHVLNHFNLFGGSYQAQANQMIQKIVNHG